MRTREIDRLLASILFPCIAAVVSGAQQSDPCLDFVEVDPSILHLPAQFANLTPPWQRADGSLAKVTRSQGFFFHWSWMKSLQVKGSEKLVEDVTSFLTHNECFFVPIGPSIRLAVLGQKPVYLTGEVSCDIQELYEKCVSNFGSSVCALYPTDDEDFGAFRLEIGDISSNHSTHKLKAELVVLHEWRSILGAQPEKWRFTVDTLAMFDDGAGDMYVIDPIGKAYDHICDKKLVPASEDWAQWSQHQPLKIMGFYELRSNGFSAKNEALQKFISDEVNITDKRVAQKFYCEYILKGVANLEGITPICHTKYPSTKSAERISDIRKVMVKELGPAWNTSVGKAADELEAVFCTDRQFVDIRSRLLHKIAPLNIEKHVPEEPKIIEEGRPMINDSSQVHARPILHMAAEPPIVPPDYPNSPHAQPNERLEIVTPPPLQVEGGGMDPVAIQVDQNHAVEDDDDFDATRHELGVPADPATGTDHNHQNSVSNDIPVMRFDKVEESGLSDVAASAMEISSSDSTSTGSKKIDFSTLSLFSFCLLYIL